MSSNNYFTYNHNDIISSLSFSKSNTDLYMISSSYDGNIHLTKPHMNEHIKTFTITDTETNIPLPITTSLLNTASSSPQIISLTIANTINITSISNDTTRSLELSIDSSQTTLFDLFQLHSNPNTFISPSFNKSIYSIDIRSKEIVTNCYKTSSFSEIMKLCGNYLISGYKQQIFLYDVRNISKEIKNFSHHAGDNVAAIEYIQNESVIIGSAEGKIAVEYFNNKGNAAQNYFSFKCHRIEENDNISAYAVNDIVYCKDKKMLISCGSDGYVYGWDYVKRKKLFRSEREDNAVWKCAVSDGGDGAIAFCVCDVENNEKKESVVKAYKNISSYIKLK